MCVYMCVYIYIYIYTHTYVYIGGGAKRYLSLLLSGTKHMFVRLARPFSEMQQSLARLLEMVLGLARPFLEMILGLARPFFRNDVGLGQAFLKNDLGLVRPFLKMNVGDNMRTKCGQSADKVRTSVASPSNNCISVFSRSVGQTDKCGQHADNVRTNMCCVSHFRV